MRAGTAQVFVGLVASCALLPTPEAQACGGCFPSPQMQSQSTVVVGHRMAFAVSTAQAVLWDQIKYAGSPKDFAWVLPIKGSAVLELSNDAWFETLDAATSEQVLSPSFTCIPAQGPGGCFCGGASSSRVAGDLGQTPSPPVTVTHEGTVGPYETVTLHANVPNALPSWLTSHGYAIDPFVKPIIDAYTSEGFDFIALRLLPGQGVQEMKPVRVVTQGMSASLPLRMVAAGTGANVAITLFVIGEGRYEAQNFPNARVDPATVTWDFGARSSNYATVRAALLATNGGRTWNTAFANQGSLLSQDTSSNGAPLGIQVGATTYTTFAQAYVEQAVANGEGSNTDCLGPLQAIAQSTQQVAGNCITQGRGGGGTGGGGTGGGATDGGSGTGGGGTGGGASCSVTPGDTDARQLACGTIDDLAVALVGLHPADVWLTRLESNLPRAALATDLVLQASQDQTAISDVIQTTNATGDPCAAVGGTLTFDPRVGLRNRLAIMTAVLGAVAAALARRRLRLARRLEGIAGAAVAAALVLGAARPAQADEQPAPVDRAAAAPAPAPIQVEPRTPTRYVRKTSTGLEVGGAVLFGAGYLGAVVTGALFVSGNNGCSGYTIGSQPTVYTCPNGNAQIASGLLFVPVAGPFMAALAYREPTWSASWALVDGIAQAGGALMIIWAATHPREVPVYDQAFQLAPLAARQGGGVQALGRF